MINLILLGTAFSALHTTKADLGQFEVRQVDRTSVFAGRLGQRVTESLEVVRDGKTYRVMIDGAYHTNFGGRKMPNLTAGDTVNLRGSLKDSTIRTNWDGVRKG